MAAPLLAPAAWRITRVSGRTLPAEAFGNVSMEGNIPPHPCARGGSARVGLGMCVQLRTPPACTAGCCECMLMPRLL